MMQGDYQKEKMGFFTDFGRDAGIPAIALLRRAGAWGQKFL